MAKRGGPRGGGMPGMGGGMNAGMMKQVQKMQQDMLRAQEDIEARDYTGSSGGGAVTAKVSGKRELLSLTLSPDAVDPDDVEMLQDLIVTAVNAALREAESTMSREMGKFTGGLNLGF
ncbi:MAG: YbaB/EbfC family nucleoid-associated protein [Oscillospiraceae bacterium]|nr:YbaB/EbfC family nucleoid-associated protein [Oscillospiraceae bacterium]